MGMKLVVGLGNPGAEYERTRHNVGFLTLDQLVDETWKFEKKWQAMIAKIDGRLLVKPQTYMNRSGVAVAALARFYGILLEDILVIHDDLDISLGEYKLQLGKGPKVHNGVKSLEVELGGKDFWRLRIGIDGRDEQARLMSGEGYVLSAFMPEELKILEGVWGEVAFELEKGWLGC